MIETSVRFSTENSLVEKLYREAEEKCLSNIADFAGRSVLVEGGGYSKVWLETQPMGGAMYAKRNAGIGVNNSLIFMENIREDGRLPGSIALIGGKTVPEFNKFQGFCFPEEALSMYYVLEKDDDYLSLLYSTLERFDSYLWRFRDSDGDGCLETWCRFDTGEDNTLRLGDDAPNYWVGESAPDSLSMLPVASMDFMSYSYSSRAVLAEISAIQGNAERERYWREKADCVRQKIRSYLWHDEAGALFDRDKRHDFIPCLTHNTLRCMYWRSISDDMADRFVREHILSPHEFWTEMPLPSISVSDPLFRNIRTNSWTGQVESLTYQRAIRAFTNYGYDHLLPILGRKLFSAIGENALFVQQYDPFTAAASDIRSGEGQNGYGPALLSVLEYIARIYGVTIEKESAIWSAAGSECAEYEQLWGDKRYKVLSGKDGAECFIDNKLIFRIPIGKEYITDLNGNIIEERNI